MSTEALLFGKGIGFPPRLDTDGRVAWSVGQHSVRDSIQIILMTDPGERLMLPSFGAGLRSFLFEPNNAATHRLIEERVNHALRRWEPRISVGSVSVRRDPAHHQRAVVTIAYTLVATRARETIELSLPVEGTGGGS